MYEFHGWVVLAYHTHDINQERQDEAVNKFRAFLRDLHIEDFSMLCRLNGMDSFVITHMHNHLSEYVIDIYKWIAENLPGSYGLLYIHDDEDFAGSYQSYKYEDPTVDNSNKFFVYRLARGQLTKHEDPFLSPYIPTVEDPYDSTRDD